MKMKKTILLAAILTLAMATFSWAADPPPPVFQELGLPDSTFNNLTEESCRFCHNQDPPIPIVDPTYLPDRHHLLVDEPIPDPSDVPYPDANGDGVPDTTYDCLNCHALVFNPDTGVIELDPNFRDCTVCHSQVGGATVHHRTTQALNRDCVACHGSFVDNFDDGHYIPTYQASLVTPYPSNKPNGDGDTVSTAGTEAGNCNFCHNTADGTATPTPESSDIFGIVEVYRNPETHHSTGLSNCFWCHDVIPSNPPQPTAAAMRRCEDCHGIDSLHNIQRDTPAPNNIGSIQPGAEDPNYGHIGNQDDCWGCHGNNGIPLSAPSSGPVIPGLYSLSASSVSAGSTVTLYGTAFVNEVQNPMTDTYDITLNSQVALTDAAGFETILAPVSITGDTIEVDIPATMLAGNYDIAAKKAQKLSNTLNLTITPDLTVTNATCSAGQVNISGSGFGSYLEAADSGTSVSAATELAIISSWSDSDIIAQFVACPSEVMVDTVFDEIVAEVTVDTPPGPDVEICDDGIDNDGDGKIDCRDRDCRKEAVCSNKPNKSRGKALGLNK